MKKILSLFVLINLFINTKVLAFVDLKDTKYPDISKIYASEDKYEKINRKVFYFNLKLNKIFVKPIHVIWSSVVPKIVMDCLNYAYINVEYPKRLVSCLLQKDFEAIKHETKRFVINSTFGLAGLFDAANKIFNLELYNEDMEQALAKCKIKCGNYIVLPFVSSTTSRDITGRLLDFILTPTTYIASPIAAAIKMGLLINRTVKIQPIIKMVEANFADSYDIAKKVYGIEKYIKLSNYDRKNVIEKIKNKDDEVELVDNSKNILDVKGKIGDNLFVNLEKNYELNADIFLNDYNPQSPVLDSIRTVLADKNDKNIFFHETSIWNRSFDKKLKTGYVDLYPKREKYRYKFLLQKDKTSPLIIIFPSVAEGVENSHNITFAKLFFDKGYSVILLGSHFQWEFVKSANKGYKPGNIKEDVKLVNLLIDNIISDISKKYNRVFLSRVAFGTSLGGYCVMFLANNQFENNSNNIDYFIAVSPPYNLVYASEKMDNLMESWKKHPEDIQDKFALISAKIIRFLNEKDKNIKNFKNFPLSNYEAELISGFVFHQKLSDLVFQIENGDNPINSEKKNIYDSIYSMNFKDYIKKYLLVNVNFDEIAKMNSMTSIQNYLINKNNYKIYHSLDDYLISKDQLKTLRQYCEDKLVLFNHGSHLGFMYRDEFLNELNKDIDGFKIKLKN